MAAVAMDLPNIRRLGKGGDSEAHKFRVFGRGGPHDWAPPPLPRCHESIPKHHQAGRVQASKRRMRLQQEHVDKLDRHGVRGDVDGFRAILLHKYGSTARGWRREFAPDDIGIRPVAFNQFCNGLRKIGYNGQSLTLWRTLSGGAVTVRLEHVEPELAEQLDALTMKLRKKYEGGMPAVWEEMEKDHGVRVDFEEFSAFFEKRPYLLPRRPQVNVRWVFDLLDKADIGTITIDDFRYLDHWAQERKGWPIPEKEEEGEYDSEPGSPGSPGSSPVAKKPQDQSTLKDFRQFLKNKYGSPAKAWRMVMDLKGCGVLGSVDFGKGCRAAGWKHHHGPICRQLEEAGGGMVTLRALDPDTAAAIDQLYEVASKDFGDLHGVWSEALDPQCTGLISRSTFLRELRHECGLSLDQARLLFMVLDVANSGWVAKEEFDFVEMFESRVAAARQSMPRDLNRGSMSAPSLTMSATSSSGLSPVKMHTKDHISTPGKSIRSKQNMHLAHSQRLKHMHLTNNLQQHCQQITNGASRSTRVVTLRATKSTPQTDLFRHTSQFYREGAKKLMKFQEDNQSEESVFESGSDEEVGEY